MDEDDVEYGCGAEAYLFAWSGEHVCACEQDLTHDGRHYCEECGRSWDAATAEVLALA